MKNLLQEVEKELTRSRKLHGNLHSIHEAFSVLLEEVFEVWEHVRSKPSKRNKKELHKELVQVANVALKTIIDVVDK